jgi:hypothetical protein
MATDAERLDAISRFVQTDLIAEMRSWYASTLHATIPDLIDHIRAKYPARGAQIARDAATKRWERRNAPNP